LATQHPNIYLGHFWCYWGHNTSFIEIVLCPLLKELLVSSRGSKFFFDFSGLFFRTVNIFSTRAHFGDLFTFVDGQILASFDSRNTLCFSGIAFGYGLLTRGRFGRSFLHATVPQHVPSWIPRAVKCPRSGYRCPTPIKSIRPSTKNSSPLHNQITPGTKPGLRGHIELAGSRGDSPLFAANQQLSQFAVIFSRLFWMLTFILKNPLSPFCLSSS